VTGCRGCPDVCMVASSKSHTSAVGKKIIG
jgi:hypothetical protein